MATKKSSKSKTKTAVQVMTPEEKAQIRASVESLTWNKPCLHMYNCTPTQCKHTYGVCAGVGSAMSLPCPSCQPKFKYAEHGMNLLVDEKLGTLLVCDACKAAIAKMKAA